VCLCITKYLKMRNLKDMIFVDYSVKRKTTLGQPNPRYPLYRKQS
jgi:hypothetical protein